MPQGRNAPLTTLSDFDRARLSGKLKASVSSLNASSTQISGSSSALHSVRVSISKMREENEKPLAAGPSRVAPAGGKAIFPARRSAQGKSRVKIEEPQKKAGAKKEIKVEDITSGKSSRAMTASTAQSEQRHTDGEEEFPMGPLMDNAATSTSSAILKSSDVLPLEEDQDPVQDEITHEADEEPQQEPEEEPADDEQDEVEIYPPAPIEPEPEQEPEPQPEVQEEEEEPPAPAPAPEPQPAPSLSSKSSGKPSRKPSAAKKPAELPAIEVTTVATPSERVESPAQKASSYLKVERTAIASPPVKKISHIDVLAKPTKISVVADQAAPFVTNIPVVEAHDSEPELPSETHYTSLDQRTRERVAAERDVVVTPTQIVEPDDSEEDEEEREQSRRSSAYGEPVTHSYNIAADDEAGPEEEEREQMQETTPQRATRRTPKQSGGASRVKFSRIVGIEGNEEQLIEEVVTRSQMAIAAVDPGSQMSLVMKQRVKKLTRQIVHLPSQRRADFVAQIIAGAVEEHLKGTKDKHRKKDILQLYQIFSKPAPRQVTKPVGQAPKAVVTKAVYQYPKWLKKKTPVAEPAPLVPKKKLPTVNIAVVDVPPTKQSYLDKYLERATKAPPAAKGKKDCRSEPPHHVHHGLLDAPNDGHAQAPNKRPPHKSWHHTTQQQPFYDPYYGGSGGYGYPMDPYMAWQQQQAAYDPYYSYGYPQPEPQPQPQRQPRIQHQNHGHNHHHHHHQQQYQLPPYPSQYGYY